MLIDVLKDGFGKFLTGISDERIEIIIIIFPYPDPIFIVNIHHLVGVFLAIEPCFTHSGTVGLDIVNFYGFP